jgi:CubicO group peptidase (beta-lactamase class C family)
MREPEEIRPMWSRRAALAGLISAAACAPAFADVTRGGRRFARAVRYNRDTGGAGLLVMRHGVVLLEDTGDLQAYTLRPLGAATRILAPLLAAALVHDELMDLDELVAMNIEGWASDPRKGSVTIRQLLSQTSGVALGLGPSQIPYAIDAARADLRADPATQFIDDPAPLHLFAEIARRKVVAAGRDADLNGYLGRRIFDPVGASVNLSFDAGGLPLITDGATASLPHWALLAELIRRGGVHRGRTLLSGAVLRDARIGSFLQPRYGLGLWLGAQARQPGEPGLDLAARDGAVPRGAFGVGGDDGNRVYGVPEASVVVVRAGGGGFNPAAWSDAALLQAVLAAI